MDSGELSRIECACNFHKSQPRSDRRLEGKDRTRTKTGMDRRELTVASGRVVKHDAAWNQKLRRRVLTWFRKNARDLPWRRSRDPYKIWISEIMLQQTQVATVIPYFERFVQAFPNVESLAKAREKRVLRHWEGLGYYRRARQMHKAAKAVVAKHAAVFPSDNEAIHALPGIGRYTAGAISSIAFDARQPILEANTVRLFSRLLAFRGDHQTSEAKKLLWSFAESILPQKHAGEFNQGLMELGATVCTIRNPQCSSCPLAPLCPTQAGGLQEVIPAATRRVKYEAVDEACIVVRNSSKVLLRQCRESERWAGLWDFPRFPLQRSAGDQASDQRKPQPAGESHDKALRSGRSRRDNSASEKSASEKMPREFARQVQRLTGVTMTAGRRLTTIKHGVTRFRITLTCFTGAYGRGVPEDGHCWVALDRLHEYPLSVTGRKIADLLVEETKSR